MLRSFVVLVILASTNLVAEQPPNTSASQNHVELPVTLQQKVIAGVTPVGTAIKAKLAIATLVNGIVIPQGATLFGKIEESVKKTEDAVSRLRIKIESASWKKGSAPVNLYFTGCYYPLEAAMPGHDSAGRSTYEASIGTTMGRTGPEDPMRPGPPPGMGGGLGREMGGPGFPPDFPSRTSESPLGHVSSHWVRLEGVNLVKEDDGSVTVTSIKNDIKLDKSTTYLLEAAPAASHP